MALRTMFTGTDYVVFEKDQKNRMICTNCILRSTLFLLSSVYTFEAPVPRGSIKCLALMDDSRVRR